MDRFTTSHLAPPVALRLCSQRTTRSTCSSGTCGGTSWHTSRIGTGSLASRGTHCASHSRCVCIIPSCHATCAPLRQPGLPHPRVAELGKGIHVVSNDVMGEDWPKTKRLRREMTALVDRYRQEAERGGLGDGWVEGLHQVRSK